MTCIVGYKKNGDTWLGCDSIGTNDDGRFRNEDSRSKIFQVGDMLIGACGSGRFSQILEYNLIIPDHDPRVPDITYLCGIFVSTLIDTCNELRTLVTQAEQAFIPGNFLVAYNGEIYVIYDDMYVSPCKTNFMACGSGQSISMGAFYALEHINFSPEEKVRIALEAACTYDPGCGGEIKILKMERRKE